MPFPADVILREVTFGIPFGIADGSPMSMAVTFTPTRSMVWSATGDPGIARGKTVDSGQGTSGSISLPVTDQAGWRTSSGALSVASGAQAFLYRVEIAITDAFDQPIRSGPDPFLMPVPQGDLSPLDLDLQIPFEGDDGVIIQIPDTWSAAVAAAQAAAEAAEAASGYDGGTYY